jgi:hypothetical protein
MLKIDVKIVGIIIYLNAYEINFSLTIFKEILVSINKYTYMIKVIFT